MKDTDTLARKPEHQVIINMASTLAVMVANTVIFLLITPLMRNKLGESTVGLWYLIGNLTGYLAIIHSSITTGVVKYVAEYHAHNDQKSIQTIVSTGIAQYSMLAVATLVLGAVLFFLTSYIPAFHACGNFTLARMVLTILTLNFVLGLPFIGYRATVAGLQRYDILSLLDALSAMTLSAGYVFLLLYDFKLIALALWTVIITLAINMALVIWSQKIIPFSLSYKYVNKDDMKRLFHFGAFSLIAFVADMLFLQTDNTVIGLVLDTQSIFVYSIGFKMVHTILLISGSIVGVMIPLASEISTLPPERRYAKTHELYIYGSRLGTVLSLPPLLFMAVFGLKFVSLWQGESYTHAQDTYTVFMILLPPFLIHASQQIAYPILVGFGKHRFGALVYLASAMANLVLSLIFVRRYGIFGVAWGTTISFLIHLTIMNVYYRRAFHLPYKNYLKAVWADLGPLSLIYISFLIGQKSFLNLATFSHILMLAIVNCLFFWGFSYHVSPQSEKNIMKQVITWHLPTKPGGQKQS